jgi:phytoene synthase
MTASAITIGERALVSAYARAEQVTAEWARSFYFANRFLPLVKRRAVFALYDYCRFADNLVDARGSRSTDTVRAELTSLGEQVAALHAGAPCEDERWLALADTIQRYPIPLEPLLDLLEGVEMDLEPVAMPDFATLEGYCRRVAGSVGLMLGPILGASPAPLRESGVRLGIAMQLTNVLRDLGEDLANGRVYLPADELARFGLDRRQLEARRVTPEFRRFMAFQVSRARRFFWSGGRVVSAFPSDGSRLTVRLLQKTYAAILDAIERLDYDVFRVRAYVSMPRKLLILSRAVWSERDWLALTVRERSA